MVLPLAPSGPSWLGYNVGLRLKTPVGSGPVKVRGATMGQGCFTAISSNRACPMVFIALSSVFQIIVLCACCPSVQWLGLRAKVPSSLRLCTRSAVARTPGPGGEGGAAPHNGNNKTAAVPVDLKKKFLRRHWRPVFPVLFGPSDGSSPQGGGDCKGGRRAPITVHDAVAYGGLQG